MISAIFARSLAFWGLARLHAVTARPPATRPQALRVRWRRSRREAVAAHDLRHLCSVSRILGSGGGARCQGGPGESRTSSKGGPGVDGVLRFRMALMNTS